MPKLLFARPLQEHERATLERMAAGDDMNLRQRALIILLSADERYRVPEIAPLVGLHMDKVRKWISRFNEQGVKGLQPTYKRPGPREKFDANTRKRIVELAKTPPRELGQLRSTWTLDSLRTYLVESGVVSEISRESLRQILLSASINWHVAPTPSAEPSRWSRYLQPTASN